MKKSQACRPGRLDDPCKVPAPKNEAVANPGVNPGVNLLKQAADMDAKKVSEIWKRTKGDPRKRAVRRFEYRPTLFGETRTRTRTPPLVVFWCSCLRRAENKKRSLGTRRWARDVGHEKTLAETIDATAGVCACEAVIIKNVEEREVYSPQSKFMGRVRSMFNVHLVNQTLSVDVPFIKYINVCIDQWVDSYIGVISDLLMYEYEFFQKKRNIDGRLNNWSMF